VIAVAAVSLMPGLAVLCVIGHIHARHVHTHTIYPQGVYGHGRRRNC
jgi:hypothetical protein